MGNLWSEKSLGPWRTSFPPAIPRIIEYDLFGKSRFLQYLRIHLSFFQNSKAWLKFYSSWFKFHCGQSCQFLIQIYDKLHSLGIWGVKKKSGTSDNRILGAPCANSRIHLIPRIVLLFCNPEAYALVLFVWFFLYVYFSFC